MGGGGTGGGIRAGREHRLKGRAGSAPVALGGGNIATGNIVNWGPGTPQDAPVPGVLPLIGLGLFGLAAARRRRG